jgi:lysophospholipid acyltransferase (LPLAT)-like uncharacterized protein
VRKLLPSLAAFLIKSLFRTLRFRVEDRCGVSNPDCPPVIWACWHNRLLAVPIAYTRLKLNRAAKVLTSPSKDGAILADTIAKFGVGSIRGSSSRRGGVAMVELINAVKNGSDIGITPDGPRGPVYKLAPGILKVAQLSGAPIMPVFIRYSSYWELKSWDRFRIPKPFSRVDVILDRPYPLQIIKDDDETAFEAERVRLENFLIHEGAAESVGKTG